MNSALSGGTTFERVRSALKYAVIAIVTFIVMQAVVVVIHELTHSTVAWLLGYMANPFAIVWGNPLTLKGWYEGVSYGTLIKSGHFAAEAIIGVSPLIMHAIIVTACLIFMRKGMPKNRPLFHLLFWFMAVNFMELIAYIVMCPLCPGDTGYFNRGLGISPWILFIAGSVAIAFGLYILFEEVVPHMYGFFAQANRLTEWFILVLTDFVLFLWGAIRVTSDLYPDPKWMFALIGFAAFGFVLIAYHPGGRVTDSAIRN